MLAAVCAATIGAAAPASASTITQNTSWTIDRAGTTAKYRITAYGDSIFAGYYGSLSRACRKSLPHISKATTRLLVACM